MRSARLKKQRRPDALHRLRVPLVLQPLLTRRVPAGATPARALLKRSSIKTALTRAPYFAVTYRLKSRLRRRRNRKGLTKKEQTG
jgi:hypothetical protein